ncbi:Spermidine hydroxycinnamoyl transferase [Glycine soja]
MSAMCPIGLDDTKPIKEIPLLLVQLTRFHGGDQGLVIGVLLSHPLTDATGIVDFMNRWAKLARGEELDPNEIPFLDRTLLKFPHIPSSKLPDRWKPVPQSQVPGNDDGIDKQKKRSDRLDSRALGDLTQVRFSVNFRNRMNPPLPHNYFGNAVANVGTPAEGDIISNPLGFAAHKIREASHAVTDEFVKTQLNVSRLGQAQLDNIRAFFMRQGHRVNIPHALNHNVLFLTSFTTMPVGKPVHFGLASRSLADRAAILPSPDGDGVIVAMFFQTALMQLFKNYFYEDMYVSLL